MTIVLWGLAIIWGALSLLENFTEGHHAPETFHADLMAGIFLIGAIIAGKLDAKEPARDR